MLYEQYKKEMIPALKEKLGLKNIHQVPHITKVTVNVGVGKAQKDAHVIETVEQTLTAITGQKPVKTKAKKSIAGFKVRQGQVIGLMVTMRRARMYDFLEKLIHITLPRVRDFRGLSIKSVDARGNLTLGIKENLAFPEVLADEIDRIHGLEICISTNAGNKEAGRALFTQLGIPFTSPN